MGSSLGYPQVPVAAAYVSLKYHLKQSVRILWKNTSPTTPETHTDSCLQAREPAHSQGIFIPSPHIRMHTQRGLSGQGQCFSLWESKAVILLSL